jgi:predicted NBD/HSP70 family sugar kinase
MTDLIGELRSRALLRELDPIRRPGAGRPTRPIDFDGEPWCVLGVQLSVDRAEFVCSTMGGRDLWQETVPVALAGSGSEVGYGKVSELLTEQLRRIPADKRLIAIEVGVPGYIARDGQTVSWSPSLDWTDFSLNTAIGKILAEVGVDGVHVGISTSSHLAALHAARIELDLPSDSIVAYFGGEREIATGLVIDGEIYRGGPGGAGDFGHLGLDPSGPACACGRHGCLFTTVSPVNLLTAAGLLTTEAAASLVEESPARAMELLVDAAAEGQTATVATLTEAGRSLGDAIDVLVGTVNPHAVVLGGFLGALSPFLLPAITERLASRLEIEVYASTTVVSVKADTPRDVGGAVLAARDACYYDPLALTRPVREDVGRPLSDAMVSGVS